MRPLATTILVLLAAGLPAPAGDDPKLDTRNIRLKRVGGKLTGSFEYTLVVGTYYEWNTDPTAVPGLLSEVTRRTGIRATVNFDPIGLDEDRIRRNPFLIMTGNRFFNLTEPEADNLRRYLRAGGFIYADDCGGADRSFKEMIKTLLPESKLVELDRDHRLFNAFYKLPGTPKILDLYHGEPKGYGARLDGRLAVFYTFDTDVPCGWEKTPDGSFVHLLDKNRHEQSYRLGVNIVTYVLEEFYKRQLARPPAVATRPSGPEATEGTFLASPLRTYRMKLQMPCNLIRDIAPAGRYVWFAGRRMLPGEQEGLARFDYRDESWQIFLDSEGVLADEANCLAADGDGLWIGTSTIRRRWNYGLWHYDPKARRSRRYTTADGLVDNDVYDLALDGDDLYVATRSGLARFDRKTRKWSTDPTHCRSVVDLTLSLAVDDRYVWAGRANGIRRCDKRDGTYTDCDDSNSPVRGMVDVLLVDATRLWIGAAGGLITWRAGEFETPPEARRFAGDELLCAAADAKVRCFGTRGGGLHVLDKPSGKWTVFNAAAGLPSNCVSRVAVDTRSIWCAFGEDPLGVGRRDRKSGKWRFYTYREGIPCNHLYALTWTEQGLVVGTMASGLWRYEPPADRWVNLNLAHRAEHDPVRRADVYCMVPQKKDLWFGTNVGLCRLPAGTDAYEIIEGLTAAVRALAVDGDNILCGTRQRGLVAYRPAEQRWEDLNRRYGVPARAVSALACDARRIWVGSDQGLLLIDKHAGKPLEVPAALARGPVTALVLDGQAAIVGTPGGVLRYDPAVGTVAAALTGGHVLTLLPTERGLLVGTRTGLAIVPRGAAAPTLDKRLAGQPVSALSAGGKHLWIGTLGHGLVRAGAGVVVQE